MNIQDKDRLEDTQSNSVSSPGEKQKNVPNSLDGNNTLQNNTNYGESNFIQGSSMGPAKNLSDPARPFIRINDEQNPDLYNSAGEDLDSDITYENSAYIEEEDDHTDYQEEDDVVIPPYLRTADPASGFPGVGGHYKISNELE